jgi:hypothetical protein
MDNQKGQSSETGNIGYTRRRQTKHKHIIICVGHHYTQTNTNKLSKSCNTESSMTNVQGVYTYYDVKINI